MLDVFVDVVEVLVVLLDDVDVVMACRCLRLRLLTCEVFAVILCFL